MSKYNNPILMYTSTYTKSIIFSKTNNIYK